MMNLPPRWAIFRLRGEDLVGEVSRQQQHRVGLPLAP
jgi:hypothetical protein